MIKIVSSLFAALLLYPVARTFYEMCVFERMPETEERPEYWPPPVTDDGSAVSFSTLVSQTYYAVSPFERLHKILAYGPRRWVGVVGLSSTILIFLLLAFSAFFPLKGAFHSYEWRDDSESLGASGPPDGGIIIGKLNNDGTFTVEQNSDNQADGANQVLPQEN